MYSISATFLVCFQPICFILTTLGYDGFTHNNSLIIRTTVLVLIFDFAYVLWTIYISVERFHLQNL
jgi:hypothetical protein